MLDQLVNEITEYLEKNPANYIQKEAAIKSDYIGQKIFEEAIYAVACADDPLFLQLKKEVIGEHFLLPSEWQAKAKSVISFFLPFTAEIIRSNKAAGYPSELWLHGRVEGQEFVKALALYVADFFIQKGFKSVYPIEREEFFALRDDPKLGFTSNWSERHVAFICGLGTFGLSKGIITKKGMAGRLFSVVTEADLPKSKPYYTEIYENCSLCGACIPRCPVDAISLQKGKEHKPCYSFGQEIRKKFPPRHGCGKCQCFVPCTKGIPPKRKNV